MPTEDDSAAASRRSFLVWPSGLRGIGVLIADAGATRFGLTVPGTTFLMSGSDAENSTPV